jgi:hypothetical protein
MDTQTLEHYHGVRIKFASLRDNSWLESDCHDEYDFFPLEAPDGWRITHKGPIATRYDSTRDSWLFSNGTFDIAAVEHETGIEILIAIGENVASSALVGFVVWAWARWKQARANKPMPSLVVERIVERFPNGTERMVKRITVKGDTNAAEIDKILNAL